MTSECGVCAGHANSAESHNIAWQSDHWLLRHHAHPAPLAGWFLLDTRRHTASAADLSAVEEGQFAHVLATAMRAIRGVVGVPRVYCVMFAEGAQHLHAHLIARDPAQAHTKAWEVADLYRMVERGELPPADTAEVAAIVARVGEVMRATIRL
ncbi:MAG: diadenosine tetraphosphate hydrolase [Phycisphaerales bacterium]|nr:diadenosine tetraphosphate hydrolase [Phycisphaerales bacterium]